MSACHELISEGFSKSTMPEGTYTSYDLLRGPFTSIPRSATIVLLPPDLPLRLADQAPQGPLHAPVTAVLTTYDCKKASSSGSKSSDIELIYGSYLHKAYSEAQRPSHEHSGVWRSAAALNRFSECPIQQRLWRYAVCLRPHVRPCYAMLSIGSRIDCNGYRSKGCDSLQSGQASADGVEAVTVCTSQESLHGLAVRRGTCPV
jgi:hypothetical protein